MLLKTGFAHPRLFTKQLGFTRATVYYQQLGDGIQYSIAFCSPKDMFTKKRGRQLALQKWHRGERHSFKIPRWAIHKAILQHVTQLEDEHVPSWFYGVL